MANGYLGFQNPGTEDKKLDTESLVVGANTVQRERVQIAGASALEIASVIATTPVGTEYGVVTRLTGPLPAGTAAIGKLGANSGVDIGDVDVTTVGTITPGTSAANLGKGEDSSHGSGDVGVLSLAIRRDTNTAKADTDNDYIGIAADSAGNLKIVGNLLHDDADAGGPVKVGQIAISHGSNPTAVSAADRTNWYANRQGIPFVLTGHMNPITLRTNYTGAQTDAALVTISTGLKIVVLRCTVVADKANTVDVAVRIGFGTANTPTGAGTILSHPGIAAGGGVAEGNGGGILGVGADNEDLRITSEVPTTGSIDVVITYFTIDS